MVGRRVGGRIGGWASGRLSWWAMRFSPFAPPNFIPNHPNPTQTQMHIHEHIEEMQNTADELRDKLAASEAEAEAAGGMLSPKKSFANMRDAVPRRKSALDFLSTSMRGGKKHSLAEGDHSAKFKAELEANDDNIMNDLERSSSGPNL